MFKKPNRRVLALVAAASLWVLIGASIAVAQGRFTDVPADHTFSTEIAWMAQEGITRGCNPAQDNTMYCPDRTLTRGEMSAFLYRLVNNLDGIAGPAGPQGPEGPAGAPGADGATGESAYQIWLDAGHQGDEAAFLEWLKGEPGPTGPQGFPGPRGLQGIRGETGERGPSGFATVIRRSTVADNNLTWISAMCIPGEVAVGGGVDHSLLGSGEGTPTLRASLPTTNTDGVPNGWTATWSNNSGTRHVHVLCATVSP